MWAALLMTGFAFTSCDEQFDNPVTQNDPSNPLSTWTYEVNVKFADFDFDYLDLDYVAPKTIYVYNEEAKLLGQLTTKDNIQPNTYAKFSGKLTGAIGENLLISTIGDFSEYSNQDGTTDFIKDHILQSAAAPILIANSVAGTVATKNVELQNSCSAIELSLAGFATGEEKEITITGDEVEIPGVTEKKITVNLAEGVTSDKFYVVLPFDTEEEYTYNFETTSGEETLIGTTKEDFDLGELENEQVIMYPSSKELDLTKWAAILEAKEVAAPYYFLVKIDDAKIIQTGEDAIAADLTIDANNVTIKDLNIKDGWGGFRLDENAKVLNVKGENVFDFTNSVWNAISVYGNVTLKGDGSIYAAGQGNGLDLAGTYGYRIDENNWFEEPNKLTIADEVTLKLKGINSNGAYIGLFNNYTTTENGIDIEHENVPNEINVNGGSLELEGGYTGAYIHGKLTISSNALSVKAKTNGAWGGIYSIHDGNTNNEMLLSKLVENVEDFTETFDGNGLRTITPKPAE